MDAISIQRDNSCRKFSFFSCFVQENTMFLFVKKANKTEKNQAKKFATYIGNENIRNKKKERILTSVVSAPKIKYKITSL